MVHVQDTFGSGSTPVVVAVDELVLAVGKVLALSVIVTRIWVRNFVFISCLTIRTNLLGLQVQGGQKPLRGGRRRNAW
jgi:hypothetical protein